MELNKQKLTAIKRVLTNKNENRPVLQCYTPLKNGFTAITDSYQLYIIKSPVLPFKVAFEMDWTKEEEKEYINKYNIKKDDIYSGIYPNIKSCIPDKSNIKDFIKLNKKEVINDRKSIKKTRGMRIYDIKKDDLNICLDIDYLINLIRILDIKNDFTLEFYGKKAPLIVRTDAGLGLILPIVKY